MYVFGELPQVSSISAPCVTASEEGLWTTVSTIESQDVLEEHGIHFT